jgi:hypothetical protein
MAEAFSKLNGGEFLGLCGIILGLIALVGLLAFGFATLAAVFRRKVQLDEMEATLKMEMIQRGMSADDIAKVLGARISANKSKWSEFLGSLPPVQLHGFGKKCGKSEPRPASSDVPQST